MLNILKYFPDLSPQQTRQLEELGPLYADWNSKINVISRRDIANLYPNHVLHSLTLARFLGPLAEGTRFIDIGTGGGLPGLPLAIMYPQCSFHLVDRVGKKVRVATEIARAIGLENVTATHGDAAECRETFDFAVSRAVMPLNALWRLARRLIARGHVPGDRYANGLLCLKGGDIAPECEGIADPVRDYPIEEIIPEPHFSQKLIVYIEKVK